ncbi:MAG: PQQ-binding-like beta-propeller repeat protein [Candidatus Tectomicrobia bacterium]
MKLARISRKLGVLLGIMMSTLTLGATALAQGEVPNFTPVTEAVLKNPAPGDWLHWRRTYDAFGYSPLDQINKNNVKNLQVAWAWTMIDGRQETTPLVYDGIMYLHNFNDKVQALNAATGDLIWEYTREVPDGVGSAGLSRSIAIHGDNIYFLSADTAIVALKAKTGELVWEHYVAPYKFGYKYTNGPLIANGVIVAGMTGCGGAQPGGCFITGHDVATGKELWRVHTIARDGTPQAKTWNGIPQDKRFGGSAWMIGSYDPQLNLVYHGTGQPYPWIAEMNGLLPKSSDPSLSNEALYTNTTLAINPTTGEVVWYHQWLPTDTLDLDYAYEQMLIDMDIGGTMRKLLVVVGKLGIIEAVDRTTGEWLWAKETVYQNVVASIDATTGKKTMNPEAIPHIGQTTINCPADPGARSWASTAYNPVNQTLYLPMQEFCSDTTPEPLEAGEIYTGRGRATFKRRLVPGKNNAGRVDAVRLSDRQEVWSHSMRAANGGSAALATGGGLVFTGNLNREIMAFDDANGTVLWKRRLNNVPNGYPVSYMANGKQFIAVPVGFGSGPSKAFSVLTPEIINVPGGAMLWVFSLGD